MFLHGFRAGSLIVTNTGCCLSAARRVPTPTLGTTIRIARLHHPCSMGRKAGDLQFLWTVGDRS
jgi:hypothetical protein